MFKHIIVLSSLCAIFGSNAYAIKNGNCWDPRTWGHVCKSQGETINSLPIEFLAAAEVREKLNQLFTATRSHPESQTLELKKITLQEKAIFVVILRSKFMPPSQDVITHFSITKEHDAPALCVTEVTAGKCICDINS